jgi:hypothetical protein
MKSGLKDSIEDILCKSNCPDSYFSGYKCTHKLCGIKKQANKIYRFFYCYVRSKHVTKNIRRFDYLKNGEVR